MNEPAVFDLALPRQILFGWGRRSELAKWAPSLGRRALVVSGSRTLEANGTLDEIGGLLTRGGIEVVRLAEARREPLVEDVDAAVERLLALGVGPGDFVLGIGGGSAIDLAKAIAGLATNRDGATVQDYLEGVGRGLEIVRPPLPFLAMPTTAGTGSEATKNAVISSHEPTFKKSLRSPLLLPAVVIVDPELTVSNPAQVTAWTGMDAITQLIESYISRRSNRFTRAWCRQGIPHALDALVQAVREPTAREPRETLSRAALLSGMALANSGLGMAHGVAAALGVHCNVPHGLACAVMLPCAMRVNRGVAARRLSELATHACAGENPAPGPRSEEERVDEWLGRIEQVADEIGVPRRLRDIGVRQDQIPDLVRDSRGSSMSGNPRELSDAELRQLLEAMW